MTDVAATNEMATTPSLSRGGTWNIAVWVIQAVLALQFAGGGVLKLTGDPAMVKMFADIGVGQWFRYGIGSLEIAAAIGLLIPRLSGAAAMGVVALMTGAIITSVVILEAGPWLALVVLLLAATVARSRWPQTAALIDQRRG
jgi:hypothetical protein